MEEILSAAHFPCFNALEEVFLKSRSFVLQIFRNTNVLARHKCTIYIYLLVGLSQMISLLSSPINPSNVKRTELEFLEKLRNGTASMPASIWSRLYRSLKVHTTSYC